MRALLSAPGAVLLVGVALFATGSVSAQQGLPPTLEGVGIEQRLDAQVPLDLPFRDEDGAEVTLRRYFTDKPVILSLAYLECPMLCTVVLNGLTTAMKGLPFTAGKEYEVVTVSFDPRETPALAASKKANYVRSYGRAGAEGGWHFLTGSAESIQKLTDAVGFRYKWVPEQKQFAHAAGIMVLTPDGRLSRYFYGVEFPQRDLRLGLVEASQGRIGSAVDQLLLFCFHYDPATGKYGAMAMNLVRVGGAVTVLLLGTFLFLMWRREGRARHLTLRT